MLFKDNGEDYSDDFDMRPGFHIGGTFELPINKTFSFETGLLLSTKGFKFNEKDSFEGITYEMDASYNLYYLDIPITAKASYNLGKADVYGLFGPYIGAGISGNVKTEYSAGSESETDNYDIEWGYDDDEDELKRLDYGLVFGAGMEFNNVVIGVSYNLGLANISSYVDDGATIKNRVLGISVGYKFGGKKEADNTKTQ